MKINKRYKIDKKIQLKKNLLLNLIKNKIFEKIIIISIKNLKIDKKFLNLVKTKNENWQVFITFNPLI